MKLSVVIPVFHVESTLERCLKSVVEQDYPNLEIILVDDGGTDQCPEHCDRLAAEYNENTTHYNNVQIIVIHKNNRGLSCARNSGVDVATGEYVTFVDSDDFLAPRTFHEVMSFIAEHPQVDIAEYRVSERYNNSKLRTMLTFNEQIYTNKYEYWLRDYGYKHSYAWNKIFRRELFQKVQFPPGATFEDLAFMPRVLDVAKNIATVNAGMYYYTWNENGITVKATPEHLTEHLKHCVNNLHWIPDSLKQSPYYIKLLAAMLNLQVDVYLSSNGNLLFPKYDLTFKKILETAKLGLTKEEISKLLIYHCFGLKTLCNLWKYSKRIRRHKS